MSSKSFDMRVMLKTTHVSFPLTPMLVVVTAIGLVLVVLAEELEELLEDDELLDEELEEVGTLATLLP